MKSLPLLAAFWPLALPADPLACSGADWRLDLTESTGTLDWRGGTATLDIPHRVTAEGAESPEALTLIGRGGSAIAILHERACGAGAPVEVQVLTQDGTLPVLLTGCCTPDP